MTVYVDPLFCFGSKQWCHMMVGAEDDISELHLFARHLGLRAEWFQDAPGHPHYDLRATKRAMAVRLGAVEIDSRELVRKCKRELEYEHL